MEICECIRYESEKSAVLELKAISANHLQRQYKYKLH
jgi:hypothetical protein